MTPEQQEVWRLKEQGLKTREISRQLGLAPRTVRDRLARARRNSDRLDPAVAGAMAAFGTDLEPDTVWLKNREFSVQLRPKKDPQAQIDQLVEKLSKLPPIPQIPAPARVRDDLMVLYPFFDVHYGLSATAEFSGEDYNYEIAEARLDRAMGEAVARAPAAARALIINGGDFTHADDDTNATPRGKHVLDVAGRNYSTLDGAVEALSRLIMLALQKHQVVEYYSVPGNHDPKNWVTIMFCLAERFRDNPRVIIERSPIEFSVVTHGEVLIAVHHGHLKRKLEDLLLNFAARYRRLAAAASYRTVLTGHNHHFTVKELPGWYHEQQPPFCAADHHAASHAYLSLAFFQPVVFHEQGEDSRYRVYL